MTMTAAGDIYTVEERSKIQGYLASVWAISSVVGPTLGGLFSQYLTWRWVFWINLPLGLVAAVLLVRHFHEKVVHRNHKIDWWGIGLLTVSLTALILAVLEGGQVWAWDSPVSLSLLVGGGALLVAFFFVESRAAEPVLPLWIFTRRLLATTSLASFGVGAILLGLTSYIPTYLERTLGIEPLVAGLAMAAILVGWPLAATPTMIAAQSSVEWNERGVVTGNNQFSRAVGSSLGVSVFGAVANAVLLAAPGGTAVAANFVGATAGVFAVALDVAVLTWGAVWAMPREKVR